MDSNHSLQSKTGLAEPPNTEMLRHLRSTFSSALKDFASAETSSFRVLRTVSSKSQHNTKPSKSHDKTLYVLDSSFNPPSRAHQNIVQKAVFDQADKTASLKRVLLLLATENADKKSKPAAFEDRLVMMTLMAENLVQQESAAEVVVDVGVTKKPFFRDKAIAIDESGEYGDIEQVHLTGYDTLTRIFDPKYYGQEKLKALEPFLSRHRVRATYRVDDDGEEKKGTWGGIEQQTEYLESIRRGELEKDGLKREFGEKIQLVDDGGEGKGVSSTEARAACQDGRWQDLEKYVLKDVANWIKQEGLYQKERL